MTAPHTQGEFLSPYAQAAYHVGCAARQIWRALVAIPRVAIGLLIACMLLVIAALVAGCMPIPAATAPGASSIMLGGADAPTSASVVTPANPKTPTAQTVKKHTVRTYFPPAAISPVAVAHSGPGTAGDPASSLPPPQRADAAQPTQPAPAATQSLATEETTEEVSTTVGGSWQDTAREMAAKLAGLAPLTWGGMACLLAAVVLFAWKPARVMLGAGKSLPALLAALGVGLICAPSILAEHSGKVAIGGAVLVLVFWLHNRATYNEAKADAAASK